MIQFNSSNLNIIKAGSSFFGAFIALILLTGVAKAAELTVNISDVEDANGYVSIAVYQGEAAFNGGKPAHFKRLKSKEGENTVVFSDIESGYYAIKLYHDANDNNKLDFNMLGMPKEGYGFSNNAGRFGPPSYADAKFLVETDTAIQINMN